MSRQTRGRVMRVWAAACLLGASMPHAQDVPTPASVLGFEVGADFHLATYDESITYFKALDEATDRLTLRQVGETSEGRPFPPPPTVQNGPLKRPVTG